MGEVRTTFTGDGKQIEAAYDKQIKKVAELEQKIAAMAQRSKRAHDEEAKLSKEEEQRKKRLIDLRNQDTAAMDTQIASVGRLALGYFAASNAVAEMVKGLQSKRRLEAEAAATQTTLGNAQAALNRNTLGMSASERTAMFARIRKDAEAAGVSEAAMTQAMVPAVSAKGTLPMEMAHRAVALAAKAAPDSPEIQAALAGGILDSMSAPKGPKTPEEALGKLLGAGSAARVTSLDLLGKNMMPGAIASMQRGDTLQEALAMGATLTQRGKDPTGATSGTALAKLATQLEEFLPEVDRFTFDAKGAKKLATKGTGMKSTTERVQALQRDPELRARFLDSASFEVQSKAAVEELLAGGGAEEMRRQAMETIGDEATARARTRELLGTGSATPELRMAGAGRGVAQIQEGLQMGRAGENKIIEDAFDRIVEERFAGKFMGTLRGWLGFTAPAGVNEMMGGDPLSNLKGALEASRGEVDPKQMRLLEKLVENTEAQVLEIRKQRQKPVLSQPQNER